MRVASWNILHGSPIPPVSPVTHDITGIADFIAQSNIDVIGLQEIDDYQERSGAHSQISVIAAKLGTSHSAYARTVIGTPGFKWRKLRKDEAVINPSDTQASYGIGLISKVPVLRWQTLALGRSLVGLPLAVPGGKDGKSLRFLYVKDEPRLALAAHLESGYTVIVTHLSFVPLVNAWQLLRVKHWAKKIHGKDSQEKIIILGDLNLPFNLPIRPRFISQWESLSSQKSYPSWKPAIQFDYILRLKKGAKKEGAQKEVKVISLPRSGYSDHLPVVIDL